MIVTVDTLNEVIADCNMYEGMLMQAINAAKDSDTVTIAMPKHFVEDLADMLFNYAETLGKLELKPAHSYLVDYLGVDEEEEEDEDNGNQET